MKLPLLKIIRFVRIYGFGRVLFKVLGRTRIDIPILTFKRGERNIGVVGCGQYAYATIGYFVVGSAGCRFISCFDISSAAQKSFEKAYGIKLSVKSFDELIACDDLKLLYISSNHASHAGYAIQAMSRGIDVYIEKPIAVRYDELVDLATAKQRFSTKTFAGYNRPFSSAIRDLRHAMAIDSSGGISVQCFVSGHMIKEDHWYRRPEEGTRVCGNLGHWLDLFIHILAWRGLPDKLEISLLAASEQEPDDNLVVSMRSDRQDIFAVMLASHSEPFEGINETINIQHGETICKIDDFRDISVWQGERLLKRHYWPKDVGHKQAILQPFQSNICRDWNEVVLSTLLMLHITEMVRQKSMFSTFSCLESQQQLKEEVDRRLLSSICEE